MDTYDWKDMFKKYRDWSCIYLGRMNNEYNVNFLQNIKRGKNTIKNETAFTNEELNKEWNVNFRQNNKWVKKKRSIINETVFTKKEINDEWH